MTRDGAHMLRPYSEIRDISPNVEHAEVKELLLINNHDHDIDILLKRLGDLDSATIGL